MTGFTAGVEGVGSFGAQAGMVGRGKIAVDFVVALFALLGPDVFGAGNVRQQHDGTIDRTAGKADQKSESGRQQEAGKLPRTGRIMNPKQIQTGSKARRRETRTRTVHPAAATRSFAMMRTAKSTSRSEPQDF